ncbi:MAG: hypothetical protein ACRCVW_01355 [Brevinema sp.]
MKYVTILLLLIHMPLFSKDTDIVTNDLVTYNINTTNFQIGKTFSIEYLMPQNISQIISIDTNIKALADMELILTNSSMTSFKIDAVSYSPVPHPMPSILVTALDKNGNTNQFYTPSFQISIANEITNQKELAFIDIEKPFFVFDWLWVIILLGILGIGVLIYSLKNYKKMTVKKEPQIIIDPFELMNTRIKELKVQQKSLNEENYKEFFVSVSEIVREFLSQTIIPLALETPTRELLKILKDIKTQEELFDIIQFVMRSTDRAKYAKQIFTDDRIDEVVRATEQLLVLIRKKYQQEKENELRKS